MVMPKDKDEDNTSIPGLDGSRFAVGKDGVRPLKPGRSVDNLTDAERKDNEAHDKVLNG
jgi:hypothetical protein